MNPPLPHPFEERLRRPVSAITAYDYPSARLCDEAGIQMILVGDSLGMVVAGAPDTTSVTLEQMAYHTTMVRRGVRNALVVSDLPIDTYKTPEETLASARVLIEAGADGVKLEGGFGQIEKVEALAAGGIPLCAHLGMLPQRVREEGGYKKKGKSESEARTLLEASLALEHAGAFAIVLESVVATVASEITDALRIPTIGIGSGKACDGQIRVLHDVIGAYPWFVPPFAKVHGNVADVVKESLSRYLDEVREGAKKRVAILGASERPDRYAHRAFRALCEHGHEVVPVNPGLAEIEGVPVVPGLSKIEGRVDVLTLYVRPAVSEPLFEAIVALGPGRVIFNPGSESTVLQAKLDEAGIPWEEACTLVLLGTGVF